MKKVLSFFIAVCLIFAPCITAFAETENTWVSDLEVMEISEIEDLYELTEPPKIYKLKNPDGRYTIESLNPIFYESDEIQETKYKVLDLNGNNLSIEGNFSVPEGLTLVIMNSSAEKKSVITFSDINTSRHIFYINGNLILENCSIHAGGMFFFNNKGSITLGENSMLKLNDNTKANDKGIIFADKKSGFYYANNDIPTVLLGCRECSIDAIKSAQSISNGNLPAYPFEDGYSFYWKDDSEKLFTKLEDFNNIDFENVDTLFKLYSAEPYTGSAFGEGNVKLICLAFVAVSAVAILVIMKKKRNASINNK